MKYLITALMALFLTLSCSAKKEKGSNVAGTTKVIEKHTIEKTDGKSGGKNQNGNVVKNGSESGGITENKGNSTNGDGVKATFQGDFHFSMSGYKGVLSLKEADGKVSGTLKFNNWGNGVPQPLKKLSIKGDRIYFERSMQTREELSKYGGRAYFKQDFYGIFSSDFSNIKGYYRYLGAQDNWEAKR